MNHAKANGIGESIQKGIVTYKAPLYSIGAVYVDSRGTTRSREYSEAMREHGLDKHTASAYVIALEYLGLKSKQVLKVIMK